MWVCTHGLLLAFLELSQLGLRLGPGNHAGVLWGLLRPLSCHFLSADDTSPGRESPGLDGPSGGQEDPASKQWGEHRGGGGADVTILL